MTTAAQVRAFVRRAHAGQTDRLGRDYVRDHLEPVAAELVVRGADAEMADPLGRLVDLADTTIDPRSNAAPAAVDPVAARRLRAKYEAAREHLLRAAPRQAPERD